MEPTFFPTQDDFRAWLKKHHKKEKELLVGFYKTDSGMPSLSWPESVDQALCFGWIDGVRRGRDEVSYTIRFTPRKPTSIWSTININKVAKLTGQGLMMPEGIAAFELRKDHKTSIYSYEKDATPLAAAYEIEFKKDEDAWAFFSKQPPGYKKQMIHRIMDAKQEKTQISRLEKLIEASKEGKRIL
ncbi:bacteriocin-protection protein [Flavipsychrobacter stenotrophus]|uniref:Bacteriocin-protection protein n=1 Tax=Flavipsychrobacter stenotrophus TaxID=2077091 RepID=A0A2S7SQY6_9BACT|nr:YdeI/OmpD-associated family protein [Flavipsychrobacter stenotrophus]PQJ09312.1 bacteriocin-protection protein [Flavipsychrobacter stenotrophus]